MSLLNTGRSRLAMRERQGFTQIWKRHDEVEECKDLGFIHIRKPTKEQVAEGYKPGEEKGEVLSLTEDKDVYLYAMEIDADRMYNHRVALAKESQARYDQQMLGVRETIEDANSRYGRKGGALQVDMQNEVPKDEYTPGRSKRATKAS